ncbi:LAMI_0E12904g1_1 [Lachancea mirantina]|uniref:LAMI_0E12904g1_1 n=1 Tax=Lachancea mirantina TaxID=1230905 RepID=A0A1G4JQN9_9SACH|nr:LAMI_0E12904g1_1 [Lachancea mirantina]
MSDAEPANKPVADTAQANIVVGDTEKAVAEQPIRATDGEERKNEPKEGRDNETSTADAATKEEAEETKETTPQGAEKGTVADADSEEERPPLPERKSTTEVPLVPEHDENPVLSQLKDAFPSTDVKYVKAVLIASEGRLDPAFSALLFLSDPSVEAEIPIPAAAAAPGATESRGSSRRLTQLEQDEQLARSLDEQFNKDRRRGGTGRTGEAERQARERRIRRREQAYEARRATQEDLDGARLDGDDDFLSQFVDKDLPELKERVGRQVQETSKRVNEWFTGIRRTWTQEGDVAAQEPGAAQYAYGDDERDYVSTAPRRTARFNSFGAQVGHDDADTKGIALRNDDELSNDDGDDIPPQLPTRHKAADQAKQVVAETTYIDTPEAATRKRWQPLPPEPMNATATPTKVNATAKPRNPDDDEFLINSDDEM